MGWLIGHKIGEAEGSSREIKQYFVLDLEIWLEFQWLKTCTWWWCWLWTDRGEEKVQRSYNPLKTGHTRISLNRFWMCLMPSWSIRNKFMQVFSSFFFCNSTCVSQWSQHMLLNKICNKGLTLQKLLLLCFREPPAVWSDPLREKRNSLLRCR